MSPKDLISLVEKTAMEKHVTYSHKTLYERGADVGVAVYPQTLGYRPQGIVQDRKHIWLLEGGQINEEENEGEHLKALGGVFGETIAAHDSSLAHIIFCVLKHAQQSMKAKFYCLKDGRPNGLVMVFKKGNTVKKMTLLVVNP